MRRIIRSQAVCLRSQDYKESSRLVTLLTEDHGVVTCLARGARRTRSRLGAALDRFALSRVIYHWRENRQLYNLSDAELIRSFAGVALDPARFLAAEQVVELCLRALRPADPNPHVFQLLVTYLSALEAPPPAPPLADSSVSLLVCSFLLKAASFLGFKPELRRCIVCDKAVEGALFFDTGRGGAVCRDCGRNREGLKPLESGDREALLTLLLTPAADLLHSTLVTRHSSLLELALDFVRHHFDPLVLNSFRRIDITG